MIKLEDFRSGDYNRLISWIDSEETLMQIAGPSFTFPLTAAQLDTSLSDKKKDAFKIVYKATGVTIGHCEIHYSENSAKLDWIIIGNTDHRGRGLGQQAVKILLEVSFLKPQIEFVELNVFNWNTGAIKCYEKMGFTFNHNKKFDLKIKDTVWTAINMAIRREKWHSLNNTLAAN